MTNGVLPILTFLGCVFASSAEAGGHRLTCLNPTIKAEPGGNVTLQWVLDPPANLSACTVDISRDDLPVHDNIVHVCVRGRDHHRPQMAQYKKRTTLNHDDLLKGIVTLIISSVKLSDSGQYGVFVLELNVNSVIDLSVVPKDDSSTTKPPVEGVTEPDDRGQRIGSKRNDSSTTPVEGLNKSDSAGGHRLTCLNPTIKAEPGGNVTLQWVLDPPANLSACTVDISRDDLPVRDNIVHACDHHRPQMAQYKKRTTLNHDDLLKGIMTLIISSVKLSDSGRYKVYVPQLNVSSVVIDLSVVPKDDSSTTKPPVEGVTEPDDRGQRIGSKRNDSSTTPVEGLNKSDSADGNRRTVGAAIVLAVFVIFCIFTALILNGKKIKNCMRTNGGRRAQEANVTKRH